MKNLISSFVLVFVVTALRGFAFDVAYTEASGDVSEIVLTTTESDIQFQSVTVGGQKFLKINKGEGLNHDQVGEPDLPEVHRWIVVGENATFDPAVMWDSNETIEKVVPYPVQPDPVDDGSKAQFVMKKSEYLKPKHVASRVSFRQRMKLGNLTILPITFYPMAYRGVRRELVYYRTIRLKLHWRKKRQTVFETTPFVKRQSDALALNAHEVTATLPSRYLIVSPPDLINSAKEVAGLTQEAEGISPAVVQIKPGTTSSQLKVLIQSQNDRAPLDAVLLFGDSKKIPMMFWNGFIPGDAQYSFIKGSDAIADVALGRLPVSNESEAKMLIGKIRRYRELYLKGHRDSDVMLLAHKEEYPGKYTANMEKVKSLSNPKGLKFDLQYGGAGATNESVVQSQPNGYTIINYRGHGGTLNWASWDKQGKSFVVDHLQQFTDRDTDMSFIFNVACDNAGIDSPYGSLAEQQLFPGMNSIYRGAVGVLGSTRPSLTEVNHRFNVHLFEFLQRTANPRIGEMYAYGNNRIVQEAGTYPPKNVYMYLLLSDPLLVPWI